MVSWCLLHNKCYVIVSYYIHENNECKLYEDSDLSVSFIGVFSVPKTEFEFYDHK